MTAIALSFYLLIGFALGVFVDHMQMKQQIPYGDWPAICPLATMRIVTVIIFTLIGPVIFAKVAFKVLREKAGA